MRGQHECLFSLMRKNPLVLLDSEDAAKYGAFNCCINTKGYLIISINGVQSRLHKLIMNSPDNVVDHKNGKLLDCRKENLRVCTQGNNVRNKSMSANNKSGYKGVFLAQGKYWAASIVHNYKKIHLGYHQTPVLAAIAYNKKALELFGEFANLNIIPEELLC